MSEIQKLEWRYVDLDQKELRLPDSKTGAKMIGKLLGHTQVQTTARYAHLASDPVKQAATKISDRLASALLGPVDKTCAKNAGQSSRSIGDETDDTAAA